MGKVVGYFVGYLVGKVVRMWCAQSICWQLKAFECFKRVVKQLGIEEVRFHDLRHTYATLSLQNGDDIKTVSESLGHATVAFTLDVYGHVTQQMKKASAARMQAFIEKVK